MFIFAEPAVFGRAFFDDLPCRGKDFLLPAVHDLVGAGVAGVCMLHHIIGIEIIFQVGIGKGIRIRCIDILRFPERITPAGIRMPHSLFLAVISVLPHVFFQGRHQVIAFFILDPAPPSKMVQAVITDIQLLLRYSKDPCHTGHNAERHITDIDDSCIGLKLSCSLRHNSRRI